MVNKQKHLISKFLKEIIIPKVNTADSFTYIIKTMSGTQVVRNSAPLGNYLTTGIFTFAFDSDYLTSGTQYKMKIICFATDNKVREAEQTFVAANVSEKEETIYNSELGTGTPSASLNTGTKFKNENSGTILEVTTSTTTKLELRYNNGNGEIAFTGTLATITKRGSLKTWRYISGDEVCEVTLNTVTNESVIRFNGVEYVKYVSSNTPATEEERNAYLLTDTEGTKQAVLTINRQDYGAIYSLKDNVTEDDKGGQYHSYQDVFDISSLGSANSSSFTGLFSDVNLITSYVTINGNAILATQSEVDTNIKNALAGYDVLTGLSYMNAAIVNNEEIYIVNNAITGSFSKSVIGKDANGEFNATLSTEFKHNATARTIELTIKITDRNGAKVTLQTYNISYTIENIPDSPMN